MELSIWHFALVFAIQALGFFIKGLAGFGDPLVTQPLLALFAPNRTITPTALGLSIPANAYIAWRNRAAFSLRRVLPIALFVVAGVVPGTFLLKYSASWILKAGLGLLVLGIGAEMLSRRSAPKKSSYNPVLMAIISFFSGFTAGLFGINLFFVAYLERSVPNRESFRCTICFVFFIEGLFRACMYALTGLFTIDVLILWLASLPGMALGLFLGTRVDKRLSEKTIRLIVVFMFMASGLSTLLKALITQS